MKPTSHELCSQVPAATQGPGTVSSMPKALGKDRLAPFEPV